MALLSSLVWPVAAANPFGLNLRVNDDLGTWEQKHVAVVADTAGNVYVAWQDTRNGDSDLFFAASADGGRTLTPSKRLAPERSTGALQQRPGMALGPKGELVVVWQDDKLAWMDFDVIATVSLDRGATFLPAVRASDGPAGTLQISASVAIDSLGNVYVAWQDYRNGNGDIRLARATLPSVAFGPSVRVDDDVGGRGTQSVPAVAVDSLGTVHVAFHDNRTGNANVYLATSVDGGLTFGPSVRVDDTGDGPTHQGLVSIALDSLGGIYAVWQDGRNGDFDIYFVKSTDGGQTFSKNRRVDDGRRGTDQTVPRIFVGTAGTLYVTWEDGRNIDADIYFAYSSNGGTTFTSSVRVDDAPDSPTDPAYQYSPQVVESRTGLVFVAWHDGRWDNGDIYAATAFFPVGAALRVDVMLDPYKVASGESANVTVRATTNGTGVDGASVSLTSDEAGTFGPVAPLGAGLYRATFMPTAPAPTGSLNVTITARASKAGFLSGAGQALLRVRNEIAVMVDAWWPTLAVGQSTDVWVTVRSRGLPLAGATVSANASPPGGFSAWTGTTDDAGRWKTTFRPADTSAGSVVTIAFAAAKAGYLTGMGTLPITVVAEPKLLEIRVASDRWEMMSWETATIVVHVSDGLAGVARASVVAFSVAGGNFSAVTEIGSGDYVFRWNAPWVTIQTYVSIVVSVKAGGFQDGRARHVILIDPNKTNPADPTQPFLLVEPPIATLRTGDSILFTLYVFTVESYAVSGAKVTLTMTTTLGTLTAVADRLNGIYTFVFTAGNVLWDTGITIKVEVTKYGYARVATRVGLVLTP